MIAVALSAGGAPVATSPTVRRRRLAAELRRLREAANLTHQEVADRLGVGFSRAKIGHIESSRVAARPIDVKALLELYGVTGDEFDRLLILAKEAKQKGWWDSYAAVTPESLRNYIGLEDAASSLRTFEPQVITGLLQTPDYAAALAAAEPEFRPHEVERWVELRMKRQEVLSRREPLRMWAVMDEAVLHRVVGGRPVMAEQLRRLVSLAEEPHITIQVLSFESGAHPAIDGPFSLLGFPAPADPDIVYLPMQTGGIYPEKPHEIARYNLLFDHLRASALPTGKSRSLIRRLGKEYEK